ncbi:MAG: Glucoamylase [Acidobacteria bacterium]|nr:Glucoamylase [Acidobacteriota bacterium]
MQSRTTATGKAGNMESKQKMAPGWPGIPAKWTSSAKSGVGTAPSAASRVWFTLSHGIFNEIYFPRVDQACTRDLGLIVTDGREFFSEEKRHARHEVEYLAAGVPAYRLINTCADGRYRIEKEIITSPHRDAVLQRTRFTPLQGRLEDYHLYALLAPHLGNYGAGNNAWVGDYKSTPMLFAERDGYALALACSASWVKRSVGFVGVSDGWQDLSAHKRMEWSYERAENGNVAMMGEIDLNRSDGVFTLALGFGVGAHEASLCALAALQEDFDLTLEEYASEWRRWRQTLRVPPSEPDPHDLYSISLMLMRVHEAKKFPGGIIASLSIPWGDAKGDEDLGGYHLVWPRDLVEAGSALIAAGARDAARNVIHYLEATQESDGHWAQNMWMMGDPYWNGVQMDETALPILLVDQARREGMLSAMVNEEDVTSFWPMVKKAAGYLVRNGPVTPEERWETDPGYSPFTLAAEIAALLAAADIADESGESSVAAYLRETADTWNANIERWIYVTDTEIDRRVGVEGHYVRVAQPDKADAASPHQGFVPIKCRPLSLNTLADQKAEPAAYIASPDALALVRFGLREAHDPRIVNTVKVIDELLKVETPNGPAWRRYVDDEYGEHQDGSAFDGTGIGRAWPLLTGERAHYELAAKRTWEAEALMRAMEAFANDGGMIPEQVWDAPDIPERELFFGRATGSAMPLVWAHAEYVKLRRSLHEGRVYDLPPQTVKRYLIHHTRSSHTVWRFNNKCEVTPAGLTLRVETQAPAVIHWSADEWRTVSDVEARDTDLGVYVADLPTGGLKAGSRISFTIYWPSSKNWEDNNFVVQVVEPESESGARQELAESYA